MDFATGASVEKLRIERASERDVAVVLDLIRGLADYEGLSHEVVTDDKRLRQSLFGDSPGAEVLLAYAAEDAVGFAVFFQSFSTFLGRPGIYLEDLFVLPEWRQQGIGRKLMQTVAQTAVERGCGRLEWAVLDWNAPAIEFYRSLGANAMDQWTVYRLTGPALLEFGNGGD
jgi:GNAT superfamily N-acetyltransferase